MTAEIHLKPLQHNVADAVTELVLKTYNSLPNHGKPQVRPNGVPEWTVLAAIVCEQEDSTLHCLSLATGVKCLPHDKVKQANGLALHDSHAEILAVRGFNRFLLDELRRVHADETYESPWLVRTRQHAELGETMPYRFTANKLYLFLSGTPCGDASLDILAEEPANQDPWDISPDSDNTVTYRGHEYLWRRGYVRFKPGRADSLTTCSKSCSDKLALFSCTSLLNTFLTTFVNPATCYLDYIVLPTSAYHKESFTRAFRQRLQTVSTVDWPIDFSIHYLDVLTTEIPLPMTLKRDIVSSATAPASIMYIQGRPVEVLFNGVKMGGKFPPEPRATSCLCRARFVKDFLCLFRQEMPLSIETLSAECNYAGLKQKVGERKATVKRSVKEALGGWVKNDGDDDFILGDLEPTGI